MAFKDFEKAIKAENKRHAKVVAGLGKRFFRRTAVKRKPRAR
jgi:hypothetical protein